MSSYTPILPIEIVPKQPVKPSIVQRLDANDQAVPSPQVYLTGAVNTWTAPESKWYRFTMVATGGAGGFTIGGINSAANGGAASATGIKRIYVNKNTLWAAVFTAVLGADCTFSDGVTTLTVRVGGQTIASGFDLTIPGSDGFSSISSGGLSVLKLGGFGGASFFGLGGGNSGADSAGVNAVNFGAGGGGAATNTGTARTGGTGGPALIIIEG